MASSSWSSARSASRCCVSAWENLPQVAEENQTEGLKALQEGQFDVAKKKLRIAARAFEELEDDRAAKARQYAEEAALVADLASTSVEEIVEAVATRTDGSEWFQHSLNKGRSVIIDAHIASLPREGRGYGLDYQIFASGKHGIIDLSGFQLFEDRNYKIDSPVTFGGRLADVTLGDDGLWRVRLDPDSGVFISTKQGWKALERLGWPATSGEPLAWTGDHNGHRLALIAALLTGIQTSAPGVPEVSPAELTKRPELIGREMVVDGRIDETVYHKNIGFDELRLVKSPVTFQLPPHLSFRQSRPAPAIRMRGTLHKQGNTYTFRVVSLDLQPDDHTRFQKGVATLAANDLQRRDAWARWAESRGALYDDEALQRKGLCAGRRDFRATGRAPRNRTINSPWPGKPASGTSPNRYRRLWPTAPSAPSFPGLRRSPCWTP